MVLIASPSGPLLPLQGGASVSSQLPRWVSEWAESVRWNAIDLAANWATSIVILGFLCVWEGGEGQGTGGREELV